MIQLPGVLAAAGHIQKFLQSHSWRFCFIGGVAVQRWGEPRLTQDVDLTLLTGFGTEEIFVDLLLKEYLPRRVDAREFALTHRVVLIQTHNNVPLDVALGAFPFEERSVARASEWSWAPEHGLLTCSAEDLLVHKVFAGRDRDWGDVERILIRQHEKLILSQIRSELKPLLKLKDAKESEDKFERMLATVERRLRTKQ